MTKGHSGGYFSQPREDVLRLIPRTSKKILECGCGFGYLGQSLKRRQECEIVGIELNPQAAQEASRVYDELLIGDLEAIDVPGKHDYFDCIVYADILEHLVNPWAILHRHVRHLAPAGKVVLSIPNIRNLVFFKELFLKGSFRYTEFGLLDNTHLRFFALKDVLAMLEAAGLDVLTIERNYDRYSIRFFLASLPLALLFPELRVCQWLIVSEKRSAVSR
jgi:2-polyprenyl-3-methyl-5-hydroxy-6-metoxy-1,4-benzoquinol methylase